MIDNNFAVFILTFGRPDNIKTYKTLDRFGYTGKKYLICSTDDKKWDEYKSKYKDIEDPQKAIKALATVKNLDTKSLIDAKKVEQLNEGLKEEYEKALEKEKITTEETIRNLNEELKKEKGHNYNLTVSNSFKSSKIDLFS